MPVPRKCFSEYVYSWKFSGNVRDNKPLDFPISSLHRKLPQEAKRIFPFFILLPVGPKAHGGEKTSLVSFIHTKNPSASPFPTARPLLLLKLILPFRKPRFPPKAFKETSSSLRFLGFLFPFASAVFPWLEKGMKSGMNDEAVELGTAEEGRVDA
ncbi:uncharacterized protein LOC118349675 [Juglans regia]|uniref:Uncharacterized protein LOC118349675 n=1 Tax=Juglans regia TaxID=51240 RepID=A0A6P9EQN8_JUGRE|nr:uncharacterized protein LOC118349675 [Juglans regia]